MAMLMLEAIGPEGERLALEAAELVGVPVGYDAELDCATFDSDAQDEEQLAAAVFEALAGIVPDWRTHLRVAE